MKQIEYKGLDDMSILRVLFAFTYCTGYHIPLSLSGIELNEDELKQFNRMSERLIKCQNKK